MVLGLSLSLAVSMWVAGVLGLSLSLSLVSGDLKGRVSGPFLSPCNVYGVVKIKYLASLFFLPLCMSFVKAGFGGPLFPFVSGVPQG